MLRSLFPIALILLLAQSASAKDAALEQTEQLIEAFKAVPIADDGPIDKSKRDAAFAKLDALLDLDGMADEAIKSSKHALSAAELAEFKANFTQLLRLVAYPNSGDFMRKAKFTAKQVKWEANKSAQVPMHVAVAEDDLEMDLEFRWHQVKGKLLLADVAIDGGSLTNDYRNQFARIIKKEGGAGFLTKLAARLAKEQKAAQ